MRRRQSSHARGVTLLEVMATMVVLLVGIAATMVLVTQINRSNRRTLTAAQAQHIAERELEDIIAMGCTLEPPCGNLVDNRRYDVWQTAAGELRQSDPGAGVVARKYEVAVDVDSAVIPNTIESGSVGAPDVTRVLAAGQQGNVANVRVSVSWQEPERTGRQVVVLQTRMAP